VTDQSVVKESIIELRSSSIEHQTTMLNFVSLNRLQPLKRAFTILSAASCLFFFTTSGSGQTYSNLQFDFYGIQVNLPYDSSINIPFNNQLTRESVANFAENLIQKDNSGLAGSLLKHKAEHKLDDWLFYQLIRSTAQHLSPKELNYNRYTIFKWLLLTLSGYDARLKLANEQLLFYVLCEESIYNIPYYQYEGKQYVCLNYHDFKEVDFEKFDFREIALPVYGGNSFSYKVSNLPLFRQADYEEKTVHFFYYDQPFEFRFKLNKNISKLFTNYPTVDYASSFNIPLSPETRKSLIAILKEHTKSMNTTEGVDYLMRFTRYAFIFRSDTRVFGSEKRLTPEQTLLNEYSDCEDRSALFFYLIKELYDLPMLVLAYPNHVTVAVKLDKPAGNPIIYEGAAYSICEPTPQKKDLLLGQVPRELRNQPYEIAYVYTPSK